MKQQVDWLARQLAFDMGDGHHHSLRAAKLCARRVALAVTLMMAHFQADIGIIGRASISFSLLGRQI